MLDVQRLDAVQCTTALEVELLAALVRERKLRSYAPPRPPRSEQPPKSPDPDPVPQLPRQPLIVEMPAAYAVNKHRLPADRVIACTATIRQIQAAVCEQFNISRKILAGPRRAREVCIARHIAYALAAELTGASLPSIARQFEGRDHTTVLHGVRKLAWLIALLKDELTPADTLQTWVRGAQRIVKEKSDKWLKDPRVIAQRGAETPTELPTDLELEEAVDGAIPGDAVLD